MVFAERNVFKEYRAIGYIVCVYLLPLARLQGAVRDGTASCEQIHKGMRLRQVFKYPRRDLFLLPMYGSPYLPIIFAIRLFL